MAFPQLIGPPRRLPDGRFEGFHLTTGLNASTHRSGKKSLIRNSCRQNLISHYPCGDASWGLRQGDDPWHVRLLLPCSLVPSGERRSSGYYPVTLVDVTFTFATSPAAPQSAFSRNIARRPSIRIFSQNRWPPLNLHFLATSPAAPKSAFSRNIAGRP